MKLNKFKSFVAGFICATLLCSTVIVGFASTGTKSLSATFKNIKLYINQQLITPKDANGTVVEPFVINGTTYLPVRAVASALGQEVSWDGSTNSVYIGSQPTNPTSNNVLMDKNGIKITYSGISSGGYLGGYEIDLKIENSTNTNYTVQVRNFSINNIMCDNIFSCDVAAGKTAIDSITIAGYMMDDIKQNVIKSFEGNFHIFDSESWLYSFDSNKFNVTL